MASGDAGDIGTSIHQSVLQAAGGGGGEATTTKKQPVAKRGLVSDSVVSLVNAPSGGGKKSAGRPSSSSSSASASQQIDKQSLIIKINRYISDDLISEILASAGFEMRMVDHSTSIESLVTKYEQIRNILGAKSAKENLVKGFLFVNSIISNSLEKVGFPNDLKILSENEELLNEIQPELNEIAIEYSSLLGSGDPKWRLLMKYGDFVRRSVRREIVVKQSEAEEEEADD